MILVNALTIESPVTTVYRIAPNAAAAPIIYPSSEGGSQECDAYLLPHLGVQSIQPQGT